METFLTLLLSVVVYVVVPLVAVFGGIFLINRLGRGAVPGTTTVPPPKYRKSASILTNAEKEFYVALANAVHPELVVFPKVRVADIVEVNAPRHSRGWQSAFNRIGQKHVDFVLCRATTLETLGAVELDDSTHQRQDRQRRDEFVDRVLTDAGLKVIRVRCEATYSKGAIRRRVLTELGLSN
jgi:hypothetical protein